MQGKIPDTPSTLHVKDTMRKTTPKTYDPGRLANINPSEPFPAHDAASQVVPSFFLLQLFFSFFFHPPADGEK